MTSAAGQNPSDHSVDERTSGSVPDRLDARPLQSRGPGSAELPGNSAEHTARERPDTPVDEAKEEATDGDNNDENGPDNNDAANGVTCDNEIDNGADNNADVASTGPSKDGEYEHLVPLLAEYAELAEDDPRREPLRERLVTGYLPVAQHIARRFAHRGEPLDDLVQVATVGLINAVDRFQPDRGSDFFSFAVPTISGEVRRHFRDQGWSMRVPRRLKDLHVSINSAVSELSQNLGRAPKPSEIAERLRVPTNEVLEGLEAAQAYRSSSLDEMLSTDESGTTLGDLLGAADAELERVDYQQALQPLLAELAERERNILMLRFFGNMTQTQIADRVGVSQMHVSRLLAQTLSKLRNKLEADQ